MNAVIEDPNKNVAEFRAPGPGERLRAARVSAGLEISKVAAQLHLDEGIVHALERDDYQAMPGRVFVRGYLRNYARLVGVPAESVLKQFDEHSPEELQDRQLNRIGTSVGREIRGNHSTMRLGTGLIVLGVLGSLVALWLGYVGWSPQSSIVTAKQEPQPTMASTESGNDGRLVLPSRSAVGTAPPKSAPVNQQPIALNERLADNRMQRAASTDAQPPPQTPSGQQLLPLPPPAAGPQTVTEIGGSQPRLGATHLAQPPMLPGAGATAVAQPGIVLQFNGPCWVDVRDAKREFKLFGEMPKGTRKVLGGVPPYDVVLGNASVVSVTIDGMPYDINRYARGNVARFVLDPTSN